MRFIHHDHAAVALGDFHDIAQGAQRARRAVDGVHDDNASTLGLKHAFEMGRVVVAKRVGRCLGRAGALPQRHVGQAVQVYRRLLVRDDLEQPQVGRITRLAEKAIFLADPVGQGLLEGMGRMAIQQEHTGLHDSLGALSQRGNLRLHDLRMAGYAQVVIAIEPYGAGAGRLAVQDELAAPLVPPSRGKLALHAFLQCGGKWGLARGGLENGINDDFHGAPVKK
jgi:hypothetical protein